MADKIGFSKPEIFKLKKQGYICADIHFHTTYSDGAAKVSQILERANELGIGFAITDHNEIKGSLEAFSKKKKKDFIIPGIEIKSKEKIDILFYFYNEKDMELFYKKEIFPKKEAYFYTTKTSIPVKRLLELSKRYKCLSVVPHPFGYSMRSGIKYMFEKHEDTLKKFDVFEGINGGNSRENNEMAIDYITEHNKGFTGGTDGHSIFPLGNIVTCSKAKNVPDFLDNIKNKKDIVVGIETRYGKFGEYANFAKNKIKNLLR